MPDWLEDTPQFTHVLLIEAPNDFCAAQRIAVTREEYISLKEHLARLRGYTVPKSASTPRAGK